MPVNAYRERKVTIRFLCPGLRLELQQITPFGKALSDAVCRTLESAQISKIFVAYRSRIQVCHFSSSLNASRHARFPPTIGSINEVASKSTVSSVPGSGHSVKS